MIHSRVAGADALTFSAGDHPRPLKVWARVGSDHPNGDMPFGWSAFEPYRVVNPLVGASQHGITAIATKEHELQASAEADLFRWADVIWWVRALPKDRTTLDDLQARYPRKAFVYDTDDYWVLPPSHLNRPYYEVVARPQIESLLPAWDLVTASCDELAGHVRPFNPAVATLPNTLAERATHPMYPDWRVTTPRRVKELTVGVHGGSTHYDDWRILEDVWPTLATCYPQVRFVAAGFAPDYLNHPALAGRLATFPYVGLAEFPRSVAEIDIAVCPLTDSDWARSKSPIKFFESALLGRPAVCSPTVYQLVIDSGINGFLAWSMAGWVNRLSELIEDAEGRAELGENARATARLFTADVLGAQWARALREAWEKKQ